MGHTKKKIFRLESKKVYYQHQVVGKMCRRSPCTGFCRRWELISFVEQAFFGCNQFNSCFVGLC